MNIKQSDIIKLNKQFSQFSSSAVKRKNCNFNFVIPKLQGFEKKYKRLGLAQSFLQNSGMLAKNLHKAGFSDFAGMIYSYILKKSAITPEQKIVFTQEALNVAKSQKDDIHTLARVVDLKRLYKGVNRNGYLTMLHEEKQILDKLVNNYSSSTKSYRSVSKEVNSLDAYSFRLATCKVDIVKASKNLASNKAIALLLEAKSEFVRLGRKRESDFVDDMISKVHTK